MARIWDISQTLRAGLPVWPGDTAFEIERTWALEGDCPVNVSKLTLSTHSGAHGDAPLHYDADGDAIDAVDLAVYCGPCRLIDARHAKGAIEAKDVSPSLYARCERVLFRTYDTFPRDRWDSDFTAISADLIKKMALAGVKLVGTDAASLDPEDSKTLDAHNAVRRAGMRILEGLVFDGVPDGDYELIALPLKIAGADAAPVRAILRELP
ncbi:arylformamidase [Hyphobacterium marinum]|uniref:Kynurenine formamidase n=1 Tax=Hyphobacterium marinum TaxID=3116574 RepID=A0ABU7LYH1_9PROT|nr:arylformamidase [Hyphobacterium sp. Y6023]MEE2566608.1 arylformamidase [Hyphobacterium sp. Y6023]